MKNILVVIDENRTTTHVLQAAVERAERERAALVVLNVMPRTMYDARQTAILRSKDLRRDGFTYTLAQANAAARGVAERAVRVAIGERAVPYTTVGAVGRPITTIPAVAAEYDCDEIMIAETKPRWFGRVGGFDRALAKRFGGTVTRVAKPTPGTPDSMRPVPEA